MPAPLVLAPAATGLCARPHVRAATSRAPASLSRPALPALGGDRSPESVHGPRARASVRAQAAAVPGTPAPQYESGQGVERLAFKEDGWNFYKWGGHDAHYIQAGETGSPVVLVHGFGANSYHWRHQMPELAKKHRVYSLCLLGYGWSSKADIPYSGELWGQQVADFIDEVVGEPAAVVGNSIGAIACLRAASVSPERVTGVALLNAAGRWGDMEEEDAQDGGEEDKAGKLDAPQGPVEWVKAAIERVTVAAIFYSTRVRIKPILGTVYKNKDMVDEDLVRSIALPAAQPGALKAFGQISRASLRTKYTVNGLVESLKGKGIGMLLLWGMEDPWMGPSKAELIQEVCSEAGLECTFVPVDGGHCPQDDAPEESNAALLEWLATLEK